MSDRRRLYLLRHAKSSWDDPGNPIMIGHWPTEVARRSRYWPATYGSSGSNLSWCSAPSARRTRETLAGVLPGRVALIEQELYLAGHEQLLVRLRHVEPEIRSVMVIGHNPALQMLTLNLAGGESARRRAGAEGLEEIRRKLPTGALVTLELRLAVVGAQPRVGGVGRLRQAEGAAAPEALGAAEL